MKLAISAILIIVLGACAGEPTLTDAPLSLAQTAVPTSDTLLDVDVGTLHDMTLAVADVLVALAFD